MATEKLVILKETTLTNNCPECFNQDLSLTFYQKHRFTKFSHKITKEVTHQVRCNTCGSDIYPSTWTDDIERIFEYYQKMAQPEKTSTSYTVWFYTLLLVIIGLIGAGVYLYLEGVITF